MLKQTDDKLTLKTVVITLISKQDKLAIKLKNKDMTKLIPYCLFPLNVPKQKRRDNYARNHWYN